jgi:serine/threonine-protein kinase
MTELSEKERRFEAVLDRVLRAREEGRPIDRAALLAASPDLAPDLEAFLDNQDWIRREIDSIREAPPPEPEPLPSRFGRYEILGEIGRGGMGVVYKARNLELRTQTVALKVLHLGRFASRDDLDRFRREAEAAAELDHPNIVPVHEYGEHDGQAYYTMRFVEGRNLEDRLEVYRNDPAAAARLLVTVAGAIRYAHRRTILHRDLKPGNILVDDAGRPHVTDFGLAKRLDGTGAQTASGELMGSLPYMAPEQFSGRRRLLTLSVDVYALGATLYALLTGRPPFVGETPIETMRKIEAEEPVPPEKLNPGVDADLSAICLMALRKTPQERYENSGAFAADLERWLEARPVLARPIGRVRRAAKACRRHPARVALGLVGIVAPLLFALWAVQQSARREEILEANAFTARFAAHVILKRMEEWGERVEQLSRSAELVGLLADWKRSLEESPPGDLQDPRKLADLRNRAEAKKLQAFADALPREDRMVPNWHVMDAEGIMMARTPEPVVGTFGKRDYFLGTLDHAGQKGFAAVHVSSIYRSQVDDLDKFDICAPVVKDGVKLGVIAVAVTTDPTLGIPHMLSERRKVVLVGPGDPSEPHKMPQPEFVVLVHPAMQPAQSAVPFDRTQFPADFPRTCRQEFVSNDARPTSALKKRDYRDPYASRDPEYDGPWLAGFAPVGNTGFVVVVQQKED